MNTLNTSNLGSKKTKKTYIYIYIKKRQRHDKILRKFLHLKFQNSLQILIERPYWALRTEIPLDLQYYQAETGTLQIEVCFLQQEVLNELIQNMVGIGVLTLSCFGGSPYSPDSPNRPFQLLIKHKEALFDSRYPLRPQQIQMSTYRTDLNLNWLFCRCVKSVVLLEGAIIYPSDLSDTEG